MLTLWRLKVLDFGSTSSDSLERIRARSSRHCDQSAGCGKVSNYIGRWWWSYGIGGCSHRDFVI